MTTVFDSETTGLVLAREPADHPGQPRLVQLGAILYDNSRKIVSELNLLVKPDGWVIPPEATKVHGITTEMCERYGFKIATVIKLFAGFIRRSQRAVAHNFPFDSVVVMRELIALRAADEIAVLAGCDSYCTMTAATPIMKLPGKYGDFKWPNLQEAHTHFCGKPFDGAHDAMADVRACAAVYFAMNPPPSVAAMTLE